MKSLNQTMQAVAAMSRRVVSRVGGVVDQVVSIASPSRAVRRLMARKFYTALAEHEAAKKDRTKHDWSSKKMSADQATLGDMDTITARARMAVRDDWCGKSIVQGYVRNVVGIGITPMAGAVDASGEPRMEFNAAANRLWQRWADRPDVVDVEGRKSLNAIIRLAEAEFVTTGHAFITWSYEWRPDVVGLSLQMFELEQLASDDECEPRAGNEIRSGVEVSIATGRPVAYWVHTEEHPLEGDSIYRNPARRKESKATRISAEDVFHLSRQSRVRETLPVSRLAPVLAKMWTQKTYDDAEQLAKKIESFIAFTIERDPSLGMGGQLGFGPGAGEAVHATGDGVDEMGNRQLNFEPGMVPVLPRGEKIIMHNPTRPGSNYGDYTDRQVGMTAAGVDLSYATVARDYSKGNFSSQRQGRLEDEKAFDIDQDDLVDLVLRPLWRLFTMLAILEGKLEAPGFVTPTGMDQSWLDVAFQMPPRPWVDPAKQAAAAKIARDYLLENLEGQLSKQGVNWRDHLKKVAEIKAFAKTLDIELPEFVEGGPLVSPSEPKPRGKAAKEKGMSSSEELVNAVLVEAMREE